MNFAVEFVILFKEMNIGIAIALAFGILLILVEMYQPNFGIFAMVGVLIYVVGIVLRILNKDGNIFAQIFLLVFIGTMIVLAFFLLLLVTAKKGWLQRSPFPKSQTDNKLNDENARDEENLERFVGRVGIALDDIDPVGNIITKNGQVEVHTSGFYIKKDEEVLVVALEENKLIVEQLIEI